MLGQLARIKVWMFSCKLASNHALHAYLEVSMQHIHGVKMGQSLGHITGSVQDSSIVEHSRCCMQSWREARVMVSKSNHAKHGTELRTWNSA